MLNWADQLIQEYTVGQLDLIKRAERLDRKNPIDREDLTQINSMIDSMAFSLEWMATGRQPETYRGVEKRAIYQKQYLFIPDITEQLEEDHKHLYISKEERMILADIFASMSNREGNVMYCMKGKE